MEANYGLSKTLTKGDLLGLLSKQLMEITCYPEVNLETYQTRNTYMYIYI